jgi:glycosyltransferase involved in cell wall biosynthesis
VPFLSVVTACYNEENNVEDVWREVRAVMEGLPPRDGEPYTYEHIFIDNASGDRTVEILRGVCTRDEHVKVIVNTRNFGHIRSPFHGLLQARGDAVISIVADLQDPPEMIRDFVSKWEEGYKIVAAVKKESLEKRSMFFIRGLFYRIIDRLSEIPLIRNFTGFGLYDRVVMDKLREIDDPYPYFRGLICDLGYERAEIPYSQPARRRGITKNNLYSLYDMAMLGITNHSKVPLRLAAMAGFLLSLVALLVALGYLVVKLIYWNTFSVGLAPLLIGIYFFGSVQLFFIGILGEYIGSIHTQVYHRPLVIERERINFPAETSVGNRDRGR